MADEKAVLTIRDVAQFVTASERAVRGWAAAGKFPKPIALGRLRRWRRADIDAWLAAKADEARGAASDSL